MLAEPNGGSACACHPERRALSATSAGLEGAAISKPRAVDLMGDRVRVRIQGKPEITAEVLPAAVTELRLDDGGELWASVPPAAITVYPP